MYSVSVRSPTSTTVRAQNCASRRRLFAIADGSGQSSHSDRPARIKATAVFAFIVTKLDRTPPRVAMTPTRMAVILAAFARELGERPKRGGGRAVIAPRTMANNTERPQSKTHSGYQDCISETGICAGCREMVKPRSSNNKNDLPGSKVLVQDEASSAIHASFQSNLHLLLNRGRRASPLPLRRNHFLPHRRECGNPTICRG